ncbi:ATP-binding protein [Actinomadura sp. KC345]|uniref:ATP-binding protein n=1 Tax=Actinomadura sp. KC345 TaxID=2530371 RepID=UPI00104B7FDF|nr:ATP-binding protein [Actinomadura sp. KC345]TDC57775.1 ATP-binding protein [Actinomadura sp. KC345]
MHPQSHSNPRKDDFALTLKPVRESVKLARDLVAVAWDHWGLGDDYVPRLVASELVTNSVLASEKYGVTQDILFRCHLDGCRPIIEVRDGISEPAVLIPLSDRSEGGRGLPLVAELCAQWWMHWEDDNRKVIGAELAVSA